MRKVTHAICATIVAAGAMAVLPATGSATIMPNAHVEWMVSYVDTNGVGVVDHVEARAASEQHFDRIANGGSEITLEDYVNWQPGLATPNDVTKT